MTDSTDFLQLFIVDKIAKLSNKTVPITWNFYVSYVYLVISLRLHWFIK